MPTKFTTSSFGTTATTDIMTTAGTPTNLCPLNTGTLTGTTSRSRRVRTARTTAATRGRRPIRTPPSITASNGVPEGHRDRNDHVQRRVLCGLAGLASGTTNVNDTWYQPENTATFNATFTTGHNGSTGQTTTCNDSNDTSTNPDDDYFEVPERVTGRSWLRTDGTRTAIPCGRAARDWVSSKMNGRARAPPARRQSRQKPHPPAGRCALRAPLRML